MHKLLLFICLVAATLNRCHSSPVDLQNGERTDITNVINLILMAATEGMPEVINLADENVINIIYSNIFNVTLIEQNLTLEGLKALRALSCTLVEYVDDPTKEEVDFKFTLPILKLLAEHYTMEGMVVDTIHLVGDGAMSIIPEEVTITLVGIATTNLNITEPSFTAVFDSVTLDIEMWRWTIDFQGLMPGSDLGTVFNEFFTMIGPELIDIWEIRLNEGDGLLNFINGIFGGSGTPSLNSLLEKLF